MWYGRRCGSNCSWCYFQFVKKTVKRAVQCHVSDLSLPGEHPFDRYLVNTLHHTNLRKNVSLHYYLTATVIDMHTHTHHTHTHTHTHTPRTPHTHHTHKHTHTPHTHTHILHNMETLVGQTKEKKIGTPVNAASQGNLSVRHFGHVCQ
jgi:hypothetical protein